MVTITPNTKYYAKISGTILDKVRSLTVEKNVSQYSGKFNLSASDVDNVYYNEFTSGDELEVIENYIESPIEVEQSYATAHAEHWYKFDGNLNDSVGSAHAVCKISAVGYYPFNANANDESTGENNGTVTNATLTTDRFGNTNSAYHFDGTTDYITLANETNFDFLTSTLSNFTISLWFKTSSATGGILFSKYLSYGMKIGIDNSGHIYIFCEDSGADYRERTTTNSYNDGSWKNLVITSTNTSFLIYINGILQSSSPSSFGTYNGGANDWSVTIGAYSNGTSSFTGDIDDVLVLSTVLDSTQTLALYNLQLEYGLNDILRNGKYNECTSFDITNTYVPYIQLGDINLNSQQDHSFSAWIYLNPDWSAQGQIIGGRRGDVTSFGVSATRYLECREDDEVLNGLTLIPTGEWVHVAYTFKYNGLGATSCTQKCYVNGVLSSSRIISNYADVWSVPTVWIGWESRFNYYFNGKIDDVRVFKSELSEYEVKEVFWNLAETKVFGGFVENVQRDKDNKYVLNIDGGDYTTKLNNIIILGEVYNNREYSVIIRDLMHKYVMDTNIIDNGEDSSGWTAVMGVVTTETGTDDGYLISRLGDACIKIVPAVISTGVIYKNMAFSYVYNNTDYITVYFYIQDASKLNSLKLRIGQDASNYYEIASPKQTIQTGWNYLEYDLSTKTIGAGTPSLTNMTWFAFVWNLDDTTNVMYLDDLRRVPHSADDYTLTNVNITPYYSDIKFKNVTVFDALRKIKDIRPNTYDFYVDIDKVLNFGTFGEIDSGQILQRGVNVLKSEFWDDDNKLCNKVTVYGGRQKFNWTETFNGTGSLKEFVLQYEPITQDVYVSSVLKKGYIEGMAPTDYDYRIDTENRTVIFNTAPASATGNVVVNYTYGVPIIVQKQDDVSITNYGLREQKIENEFLLSKEDAQAVAVEYIDSWKDPILNAKYNVRINTNIDIGEKVGVIDERYFGDSTQRYFGTVSLKHTFIGGKMGTELNLTQITKSVEMYLQEIFTRLNALEEKEKGDSDVLRRLMSFEDTYILLDDPESNLVVKLKNIAGDVLIWGSSDYGTWGVYKWGSAANASFILGLAKLGVNGLGSVSSDWGNNQVLHPSD